MLRAQTSFSASRFSERLIVQPDLRLDAHAGAQKVVFVLTLFDANPDWQTLDDLYVVAGRVLGRQQAEACAARPRKAFDITLVIAIVGIYVDGHALPYPHLL